MQAKVRIAQPRATAKAVPHATRDLRKRIVDAQVESMFAMVRPTLLVGFLSACLVGAVLYWLYAIALWRLEVWIALHFAHLIVRAQISRLYWRARRSSDLCRTSAPSSRAKLSCWA